MSELFDPLLGDPAVAAHLSDRSRLQAMLDVETELARASARVGLIPERAVEPIRAAALVERFDLEALAREARESGNLAIPLVAALTRLVEDVDPEAAGYVHWGATSQDIIDTGLVLQLRSAVGVVLERLATAGDRAALLASRHAATPMPGRTWLQHATPITFGLKAAGWCEALDRAHARARGALDAASILSLGGAAGTTAGFGPDAGELARELGRALGLAVPTLPWHAHRDRLAELGASLGIAAGTLGKIGRDLALLAQTEVEEASEARPGGSSAMPQKRNPVAASVALAAALRAPGLVATLLAAMPAEHERGLGGWQAEWEVLPELVRLTGGAARAVADALGGLEVDAVRMRANLELGGGSISAEAVVLALGRSVGRRRAHQLVAAAAARARGEARPLARVLADDPEVARHCAPAELDGLLDPDRYVAPARMLVERALRERRTRHA